MEAGYAQNQQTQERQDNHTRPYTNGTVLHNSGPVHIVTSEYQREKSPEPKETSPEAKFKSSLDEVEELVEETEKGVHQIEETGVKDIESAEIVKFDEIKHIEAPTELFDSEIVETETEKEIVPEKVESNHKETNNLVDLTEPVEVKNNGDVLSKVTADFIEDAKKADDKKTRELLEEALDEEEYDEEDEEEHEEPEKSSVKVLGMEVRAESADGGAFPTPEPASAQSHAHHPPAPAPAPHPPRTPHEAEEVQSIFLETEIPQKSRVLVDFEDDVRDQTPPAKHSPMVVSGKMTLSLIQDAPRDTPERDAESTVDDFTTASALTQDAAEKEGSESEEEIEEEIEVEEIEEEVEVEEIEEEVEEEEEEVKPKDPLKKGTE